MSNPKLTQPIVNRARLESLVQQAKEIQKKHGDGVAFEIRNAIADIVYILNLSIKSPIVIAFKLNPKENNGIKHKTTMVRTLQ